MRVGDARFHSAVIFRRTDRVTLSAVDYCSVAADSSHSVEEAVEQSYSAYAQHKAVDRLTHYSMNLAEVEYDYMDGYYNVMYTLVEFAAAGADNDGVRMKLVEMAVRIV